MPSLAERYPGPASLPERLPVFPLRGAILLPRASLPLQVFEPRYLAMLDDVIAANRLLGIIQPDGGSEESPAGKTGTLRKVGTAGRVVAFQELDDGRLLVTLTGIARFEVLGEIESAKPYRTVEISCTRFAADFEVGRGEDEVDRQALLKALKAYLEARNLRVDWGAVSRSSTESLVNSLSIVSPYGTEEKQALLEAVDLKSRAEMLVALAEMELAAGSGGSGSTLQ
ncbi:MAG: LON peptidase substrate-binding domain-containing protein [Hyphomicrobiaceae bacterium]|nr:LON peptidase substrate-binding domain-containing protein [Hyphomicrobiaceae bacterium]